MDLHLRLSERPLCDRKKVSDHLRYEISCLHRVGLQKYAVGDLASIYIIKDDMRGEQFCKTKREKGWKSKAMTKVPRVFVIRLVEGAGNFWQHRPDDL